MLTPLVIVRFHSGRCQYEFYGADSPSSILIAVVNAELEIRLDHHSRDSGERDGSTVV